MNAYVGGSGSNTNTLTQPANPTVSPVNLNAGTGNINGLSNNNQLIDALKAVGVSTNESTNSLISSVQSTSANIAAMYETAKTFIKAGTTAIHEAGVGVRQDYKHIFESRKEIGGISLEELEDRNAILNNYSRQLLDDTDAIQKLALGMTDTYTNFKGPNGESALSMIYKTDEEAVKSYYSMITELTDVTPAVLADLNAKSKEELVIFKGSLEVSDKQITALLNKQMAYTGEANADVLGNIANVSVAMGNAVGTGANDMKDDILSLTTNVNRFGNLGEIAAGKLAASLHSAGLEVSNLETMLGKADTFDGAARMAGDFSSMYGVQIDAMKATYLANEDQEEYFKYIRRQILDANLDMDNMSHARKRSMAQDLGMEIPQLMNFIKTGQQQISDSSLDTAAAQAAGMDGLTTAVDKFGDKFARSMATPEQQLDMMKRKIDVDLSESAIAFGNRMSEGYQTAFNKIKIPDSGKELIGSLYKVSENVADFTFDNILNPTIDAINSVLAKIADVAQNGIQAIGGTVEGSVRKTEISTFALMDQNGKLASEVSESSKVASDNNAQMVAALSGVSDAIYAQIEQPKPETQPTNLVLDGEILGRYIYKYTQNKYGYVLQAEVK
jgi:hypothetical protein